MKLTENFNLNEFACHDKKRTPVPAHLLENVQKLATELQKIRDVINCPIHINSGYRTPEYNKTLEGAAKQSYHMKAMAADIVTINYTPYELAELIENLIKEKKVWFGGLGLYSGFLHVDIRPTKARWKGKK